MSEIEDMQNYKRRDQIIEAAFECFGRKGLEQTSMEYIRSQAGLSNGEVDGFFTNKYEILEALAEKSRNSTDALF